MKKNVYVYNSGTLKQENNTLALITKNKKTFIPIEQIENIHIFSEINLNKRLLQLCSKNKIIIMFYSYYGNYLGSYIPQCIKNGKIIIEQVQSHQDQYKHNEICNIMINGNIDNELALLKYYNKKGNYLTPIIDSIKNEQEKFNQINLNDDDYIKHALLYEARIKQLYYSAFDVILKHEKYKFVIRSKRPPNNEINAMLSYGYSVMYGDVLCAISRSKLVPEISYIHSVQKHGLSLHFDLADMLKPVIVDRLVLRLVRKKQISGTCFTNYKGGIYLSEQGKKLFIEEYDKLLKSVVYDSRSKRNYTYKQLYYRDVYLLTDHILSKKQYKPFKMRW